LSANSGIGFFTFLSNYLDVLTPETKIFFEGIGFEIAFKNDEIYTKHIKCR